MKTIRLLMMFAAWLLSAAHTMVNAQILVSQKEAVKAAVNYVNGYLMGDGEILLGDETPKSAKQDDVIGPLLTTEWGKRYTKSGYVANV